MWMAHAVVEEGPRARMASSSPQTPPSVEGDVTTAHFDDRRELIFSKNGVCMQDTSTTPTRSPRHSFQVGCPPRPHCSWSTPSSTLRHLLTICTAVIHNRESVLAIASPHVRVCVVVVGWVATTVSAIFRSNFQYTVFCQSEPTFDLKSASDRVSPSTHPQIRLTLYGT
jgi:hypothetical protein